MLSSDDILLPIKYPWDSQVIIELLRYYIISSPVCDITEKEFQIQTAYKIQFVS